MDAGQPTSPPENSPRYSVAELAELADVSRRAIRFYVTRGLLAPPEGVGRGAYYTGAHRDRLLALKRLQESGLSLDEVAAALQSAGPVGLVVEAREPSRPRSSAPAERWLRVRVRDGVELLVRDGILSSQALETVVQAVAGLTMGVGAPGTEVVTRPLGAGLFRMEVGDDDDE
jgi:DNA-binding transcriptional MerR regulator